MITLNPFVENNKARINQFLNNLCEVGDFYDTLEVRALVLLGIHPVLTVFVDGSVHGPIKEGPYDSYHVERDVQYTLLIAAAYRYVGMTLISISSFNLPDESLMHSHRTINSTFVF